MLSYLIQMLACSGLLYAYYHFFLRNERFHQYNRYYLLASMLISLAVPFLKIPVYIGPDQSAGDFTRTLTYYNQLVLPEVIVTNTPGITPWQLILTGLWAAVAMWLLLKILLAVISLVRIRFSFNSEKLGSLRVIHTKLDGTPFSFFSWIFWHNDIEAQSKEGSRILRHEMYHARQWHSLDILFAELVCAAAWINPFFHLMKKEIKAIHEFLADRYAAQADGEYAYAETLILQAMGSCPQPLVNPFFNNQLKRRIHMLTHQPKSTFRYARKILVVPVLALIAGLFVISCKNRDTQPKAPQEDSINVTGNTALDSVAVQKPVPVKPDSVKITDITIEPANEPEIFTKVEIDAAYPGGSVAWRNFLQRNLKAEVATNNGATAGRYTVIVQFVVDKEGNVSDVTPLTRMGHGMEEEAVRVIKNSGKWKPAIQNGREVKAYRKQPITFQIDPA